MTGQANPAHDVYLKKLESVLIGNVGKRFRLKDSDVVNHYIHLGQFRQQGVHLSHLTKISRNAPKAGAR
ncbi:hypothetical protein SAMN05216167_10416 [Spirosoma endophyticum]|uniref:Uncharacterized protein n=1 Tax=Spirosoma endophyticum TaxID=662367 RepID=A0A1I1QLN4_9BACT|nr:hypothetical protein SAMN05216167_10416 [Spirosoma endophyticum]